MIADLTNCAEVVHNSRSDRASLGERGDTRSGLSAGASPVILPGTALYNSEGDRRCDAGHSWKRAKAIDFLAREEVIAQDYAQTLWRMDLNDGQRATISPYNWDDYPLIAVSHGLIDREYQRKLARFVPPIGTVGSLDYERGQNVWLAVGVRLFINSKERIPTSDEEVDMAVNNAPVWRAFYVVKTALKERISYYWAEEILASHRALMTQRLKAQLEASRLDVNPNDPDFIH